LTIGHIAKNLSHNETPSGDVFFNDITKLLTAVVADVAVIPAAVRNDWALGSIYPCEGVGVGGKPGVKVGVTEGVGVGKTIGLSAE
jgi:hypothetical protein